MSTTDAKSRVAVKTYVPKEQKRIWEEHAAEMNMTMSEFIRTMVQSGRSPFNIETPPTSDAKPRGDGLESTIHDILRDGPATFDELSASIIGEIEIEIDDTLKDMKEVTHSGRTGKYELIEP